MKPIAETVAVAAELGRYDPDLDVMAHLQQTADEVTALVPDCIGLSVAWLAQGVAFTLVATAEEIAVLDGIQYLVGRPTVTAASDGHGVTVSEEDFMSEHRWQLFAQAAAAHAVRSTLTLPLLTDGQVTGSANLYAASDQAFEGHHKALATILGASSKHAVRNADLSFASRVESERAPAALRDNDEINQAVGVLITVLGVDAETAHGRLVAAARRAGLTPVQLARGLANLL